MKLLDKKILVVLTDGVDHSEFLQIKRGFENEKAQVIVSSPQESPVVETVAGGRRGRDILIDLPFEVINETDFDALVIPDGILSVEMLRKDVRVINLIYLFHKRRMPIFVSGNAVQLLYDSQVLSDQVVVREGTPVSLFIDRAVDVLLDHTPFTHAYRPTIAS